MGAGLCGSWLACDSGVSGDINVTAPPPSQASQLPHFLISIARQTGKTAVIGSLSDIEAIVQGSAGTRISTATPGITYL